MHLPTFFVQKARLDKRGFTGRHTHKPMNTCRMMTYRLTNVVDNEINNAIVTYNYSGGNDYIYYFIRKPNSVTYEFIQVHVKLVIMLYKFIIKLNRVIC